MTLLRTDYRAVTRDGKLLRTLSEQDLGRALVRKNQHLHDGVRLECVELIEARTVAYRPRPIRRAPDPYAIPAMPA